MDIDRLTALLQGVQTGEVGVAEALERLRSLPYDSVGDFAQLDTHRAVRTGAPEVVYCPGKSNEQVAAIMQRLTAHSGRVLATRATEAQFFAVKEVLPQAIYHPLARLITNGEPPPPVQSRTLCRRADGRDGGHACRRRSGLDPGMAWQPR